MFDSYSSWRIVTWWYGWVGGGTPWRITWSTTDLSKCSSTSAWCPESHTMWATSTSTSSPSTSPMPRWPVSTMGTSTERWVYIYTQCIMGLAHRVMYIHIKSWACSLREVCKQCIMGMPAERWKLVGVPVQSVSWAYPFFWHTEREISCSYIALTVAASILNQVVHVFGEIWVKEMRSPCLLSTCFAHSI